MTLQEKFAVDFFMTNTPDIDDFTDMLDAIARADDTTWESLEKDDDMPIIWEPYETYASKEVARMIESLARDLTTFFVRRRGF